MASRRTTDSDGGGSKEDPRLQRIRENQRRSRARRREYLEDLEARWKRCQELGVQADVELQRAARKVIEENNMLREILAELGVGREEVERRLRGFRAGSTASGNETGGDGGGGGVVPDNGCGGGGGVGTSSVEGFGGAGQQHFNFPRITTGLEAKSDAPAVPPGIESLDLSQLDLDIDIPEFGADAAAAGPATAVAVNETPDFSMSLMEPIQDFDNMFDISEFIEQPFDFSLPMGDESATITTTQAQQAESSPAFTTVDSQTPSSLQAPPTTTPGACSDTCRTSNKNTTPCTEAYALLKALNAQRQEHKDMFEIVLELWNGFCYPSDAEGSGCRVDNEVLKRVIDGMQK
ncbi:uncharacterized protein H6S33_003420 [Morchella sextelata]|uniref:uncharacterized protein n=1 Tax=Morchella sextelata TaxID=1174677 RepID=UPI001D0430C3|nr:uncharacterized protein H6S33_003420 [Morchella sextelata]KAH0606586.1 hypothetical protein H6S33_003420 [Morchella sextelata]